MSTVTPGVVIPVSATNNSISGSNFNTSPSYSGTFIPTIWSGKLNAKFYTASTFADICNRNWEGDISNLGDKVIINNIPSISIADYQVGQDLTYQTPVPDTIEMVVDRAKSFSFQLSDVLEYQSKPDLMDMFSNDASEQMRTVIDSTCLFRTVTTTPSAAGKEDGVSPANRGGMAGVKSGAYNLGTDTTPVDLSANAQNALNLILALASVLDEQNIPESERFLLIDPLTRWRLMQSNLAQAQFMGDDKSMIRNGMIGKIDRFMVYVTNHLPRSNGAFYLSSGDGTEHLKADGTYQLGGSPVAQASAVKRRLIVAGHKSGIAFASQMTKTEQLRNPKDFGDLVRGLNIFGHKVMKGTALATALVAN